MGNVLLALLKRGMKTVIALAAIILLILAVMRLVKRVKSCGKN